MVSISVMKMVGEILIFIILISQIAHFYHRDSSGEARDLFRNSGTLPAFPLQEPAKCSPSVTVHELKMSLLWTIIFRWPVRTIRVEFAVSHCSKKNLTAAATRLQHVFTHTQESSTGWHQNQY